MFFITNAFLARRPWFQGKISFCFAVGLAHRSQPFYLVPLVFVSSVKSLFDFITLPITQWLTNQNKDNILHSITIKTSLLSWIPSGLAIRLDQVCQGILIKITINLYLTTMLQCFCSRYIPLNVWLSSGPHTSSFECQSNVYCPPHHWQRLQSFLSSLDIPFN